MAKEDPKGRVRVFVRCRPPSSRELEDADFVNCVDVCPAEQRITVKRDIEGVKNYFYDNVLEPTVTQSEVFATAAQPVVEDVLEGYNGTIMAYGQTGTGKTFTLSNLDPQYEGIIPQSMRFIFERISQDAEHSFEIRISYVQIYMEMIQDLLNPEGTNLQIREDVDGVYIAGVSRWEIRTPEECFQYLRQGDDNRAVANTNMNAVSSRSHSCLFVYISRSQKMTEADYADESRNVSKTVLKGKLVLVDLAGSERVKKTGAVGKRKDEGIAINLSLSALGNVIHALTDSKISHVPYRDSKLTRLLQDSLGGNAKTSLVVTCGPALYNVQETISSLLFGRRAMKVQTHAKVNQDIDYKALALKLQAELDKKEDELRVVRSELDAAQSALKGLRHTMPSAELKAQSTEELLASRDAEIASLRAELAGALGGSGEAAPSSESMARIMHEHAAEKDSLRKHFEAEVERLRGEFEAMQTDLEQENETLEAEISAMRDDQQRELTEIKNKYEEESTVLMDELELQANAFDALKGEFDKVRIGAARESEELRTRLAELEDELQRARQHARSAEAAVDLADFEEEMEELRSENEELQEKAAELDELRPKYAELEQKYSNLEDSAAATETELRNEIEDREQEHDVAVTALNEQLSELQEQLRSVLESVGLPPLEMANSGSADVTPRDRRRRRQRRDDGDGTLAPLHDHGDDDDVTQHDAGASESSSPHHAASASAVPRLPSSQSTDSLHLPPAANVQAPAANGHVDPDASDSEHDADAVDGDASMPGVLSPGADTSVAGVLSPASRTSAPPRVSQRLAKRLLGNASPSQALRRSVQSVADGIQSRMRDFAEYVASHALDNVLDRLELSQLAQSLRSLVSQDAADDAAPTALAGLLDGSIAAQDVPSLRRFALGARGAAEASAAGARAGPPLLSGQAFEPLLPLSELFRDDAAASPDSPVGVDDAVSAPASPANDAIARPPSSTSLQHLATPRVARMTPLLHMPPSFDEFFRQEDAMHEGSVDAVVRETVESLVAAVCIEHTVLGRAAPSSAGAAGAAATQRQPAPFARALSNVTGVSAGSGSTAAGAAATGASTPVLDLGQQHVIELYGASIKLRQRLQAPLAGQLGAEPAQLRQLLGRADASLARLDVPSTSFSDALSCTLHVLEASLGLLGQAFHAERTLRLHHESCASALQMLVTHMTRFAHASACESRGVQMELAKVRADLARARDKLNMALSKSENERREAAARVLQRMWRLRRQRRGDNAARLELLRLSRQQQSQLREMQQRREDMSREALGVLQHQNAEAGVFLVRQSLQHMGNLFQILDGFFNHEDSYLYTMFESGTYRVPRDVQRRNAETKLALRNDLEQARQVEVQRQQRQREMESAARTLNPLMRLNRSRASSTSPAAARHRNTAASPPSSRRDSNASDQPPAA